MAQRVDESRRNYLFWLFRGYYPNKVDVLRKLQGPVSLAGISSYGSLNISTTPAPSYLTDCRASLQREIIEAITETIHFQSITCGQFGHGGTEVVVIVLL